MATVTLPMRMFRGDRVETISTDFVIDKLSFTRSITRQGKGARAAWRHQFRTLPEIPQSHAVIEWNSERAQRVGDHGQYSRGNRKYGIRAVHRALQSDPWAMIDKPSPALLHGDEQAAPGSDDR